MNKYVWVTEEDYDLTDGTKHTSRTYHATKKATFRTLRDISMIGTSGNMYFAYDVFDNLLFIKREIVNS